MKKLFIIFFLISVPLCAMKNPETIAEFIKDQNYYEQKKLYKENKGNPPLENFVDALQQSNETVQSIVKKFLKVKRKEAEEQLKKDFKISEEQWREIQNRYKELKGFEKQKENKTIVFDDEISNEMKALITGIHRNFSLKRKLSVQPILKGMSFWQKLKFQWLTFTPLMASIYFDKENKPLDIILINEKQLERFQFIEKRGMIAHEMSHLEKHHSIMNYVFLEKMRSSYAQILKSKYAHNREYEADQYAASKNFMYACGLEDFLGFLKRIPSIFQGSDHPLPEKRYQAVKTIRKLLQYEKQWYAGPKGYHKYGEPAYERMWDKYCELAK